MGLRLISLVVAWMTTPAALAQFTYSRDQSIPVKVNSQTLSLPWSGGLNSPQYNTMDLNGDNRPDLVIFDRTANKILTYLNVNQSYRYTPEFESMFPTEIDQWMLLRDFNCDGKKDIFTSDPFGMKAFVNVTAPGGPLRWRQFNGDFPILTIGFTGTINLQVNGTDIPAIDDIDGDGDLDILDARFVGIGSLEWHKNMSVENTGRCDSMQFQRITQTWGNFEECNCGKYIFGPGTCSIFGGRTQHAAGKSILTIDLDNDGDRDLLFTEETCTELYLLPNDGTASDASMTGFTPFPANAPLSINIFPAPYYEDLDFDGVPDLAVAANIYTRNSLDINFQQSSWLYKNTGTSTLPVFTFVKNNFMQDQMIEVGDNSAPAFIDADGDGDLDLFVGNYIGAQTSPASLTYFENTGSLDSPLFTFVTADYAGISALQYYNLRPQFVDMNNDGKADLALTGTSLQTGTTTLFYIANQDAGTLNIGGQSMVDTGFTLAATENLIVVDVNKDGKKDILLGKATGSVEFWQNNGSGGTFHCVLQNNAFLGLGTSTDRQNLSFAVADLDADGKEDLITGDQRGALAIYADFRSGNSSTPFTDILFDSVGQSYRPTAVGGHAWPVAANIFNTNRPAIVTGNTLGGLVVLRNNGSMELPDQPVVDIYPNPIPKGQGFFARADRDATLTFFSVLGQRVSDEIAVGANQSVTISPLLAPGMYVARFMVNGQSYSRRLVIY